MIASETNPTSLLIDVPGRTASRSMEVRTADADAASSSASSVLFGYTANVIHDGGTPVAERRAQMLLDDRPQLRDLPVGMERREPPDAEIIEEMEVEPRHTDRSRQRRWPSGPASRRRLGERPQHGAGSAERRR